MKKIAVLLVLFSTLFTNDSFSQKNDTTSSKLENQNSSNIDSTKNDFYIKGAVTITNKGISYIPNLSLGKPAIIFDLSMANRKLSFEPQLRFALTGEPWSFLFPIRYKIKSAGKIQLSAGVNPLLNFKHITYTVNGVSVTELVNRRYLGGELRPNYFFTKNISIGMLYLYFSGVSDRAVKNTNFLSINTNFSNIKLGRKYFSRFNPQFYYLNQDAKTGFYFNSVMTLSKKDFPFSIQNNINTSIHADMPGSEKFIWNLSLIYSFNRVYRRYSTKIN